LVRKFVSNKNITTNKKVQFTDETKMSTIRESMMGCISHEEVDMGALCLQTRTTSFQSTIAPPSSAPSECAEAPCIERAPAPCTWQDAVWTTDVPARGPELEANPEWKEWVAKVEKCSKNAFDNNCLEMVSKRQKFKLAVLTAPTGEFLGFSVYKINRGAGNLTIGKIAVSPDQRGYGYGKRMIKETIKMAKKDKMIYFVSLSSLPEAIKFYKRMHFKEFKDVKFTAVTVEEGESWVEGQMYMEYKIRNAPKNRKK